MWVATVTGSCSSLLTWLAFNSEASESLLSLCPFWNELMKPHPQLVSCNCQCYPFKMLIKPIIIQLVSQCSFHPWFKACWPKLTFGTAEGELLLSLVPVQAHLSDTLDSAASGWLLSLVSNWAHWPNTWFCRMWVATVSDTFSRLLTEPPLGLCSM